MTHASEIESNPEWMPHAIDPRKQAVEFLRVPSSQLSRPGFLFEFQPRDDSDRCWISFADVVAMRPTTVPLHFIFHSAFCRSTLLARALNLPGVSAGLSEPGIFASLTNAGPAAQPVLRPVLALLGRARADERVVFAKPTNHANRLIPSLMEAIPDAKAILMTNDLSAFLGSVHRRGLMGRRWGRELYLEMQGYAGIDFQMSPRETFAMTDMQAAGLAWLLNQNLFRQLASGRMGERMRVLDGDRFNRDRAAVIQAALALAGVPISNEQAAEAAVGPVFATHAKLGGSYRQDAEASPARREDPLLAEETAQVRQWLEAIARQLDLEMPIKQTLV